MAYETFSISIGDHIALGEQVDGKMQIQTYEVIWVGVDGGVHARNVRTGLERTWPGYGHVVRKEAKV